MTIARMTEADAQGVHDFLANLFQQDVETGGVGAPSVDLLAAQVKDGVPTWVAIEAGKIVGVLGPEMRGVRRMPDGILRTFSFFNRLAVDYTLYKTSRREAIRVARELTVAAANDLQANPPDDIRVQGPTGSRGASWCRLLKFAETVQGGSSEFWLEFKDIWDRCKGTETIR